MVQASRCNGHDSCPEQPRAQPKRTSVLFCPNYAVSHDEVMAEHTGTGASSAGGRGGPMTQGICQECQITGGRPMTMSLIGSVDGFAPSIPPEAWIAPGAVVAGRVTLGREASVWYGSVL